MLKDEINAYIPFNEQEEKDKEQFLKFMEKFDDVLTRNNVLAHFSASAFVVNKERTKMLVVYHIINDGWIYPGGHADGIDDLLQVALREVEEETGLKARVLDNNIFAINSNPVKGHVKRGEYVSAHLHLDCVYLMEADEKIPLVYREDESKGAKWVDFKDAYDESFCDFIRPVHKSLIKKLNSRGV